MALNEDAAVAVLLVITKIFIIAIKIATNRNIDNDMNMTTDNDQNVNDNYENHIMQILTMMKKNLRLPKRRPLTDLYTSRIQMYIALNVTYLTRLH